MSVKFQLHEWIHHQRSARRSLRNNYLKFIRNWGIDSNSVSGAVLKSWVESRIGMAPSYHRGKMGRDPMGVEYDYRRDVIKGSSETSAIYLQLDLLFEFCQYELKRRYSNQLWLTLFRGTHDSEEYEVIEEMQKGTCCVRLNNLGSFTSNKERAWEFGSTVWQVKVPIYKVFFFSGLLPDNLLKGEDEYIVIGGEFCVKTILF